MVERETGRPPWPLKSAGAGVVGAALERGCRPACGWDTVSLGGASGGVGAGGWAQDPRPMGDGTRGISYRGALVDGERPPQWASAAPHQMVADTPGAQMLW